MNHYATNPLLVKKASKVFNVQIYKVQLLKKKYLFFLFSPGNLLIIFYQLTMFEAPSYNNFRKILMKSFRCQNLQKAITRKNKHFFKFFTRLSTHYLLSAD